MKVGEEMVDNMSSKLKFLNSPCGQCTPTHITHIHWRNFGHVPNSTKSSRIGIEYPPSVSILLQEHRKMSIF